MKRLFTVATVMLLCLVRVAGASGISDTFVDGESDVMPEWRFTHFNTTNSSLSYDGVSKITQDSRGFIWIGTFRGLNRYDGTRFKVYRRDDLGLDSDFVHTIIEDREGNLWIGTDTGVSRYIWAEDRFEAFSMISDKGTRVRNKVTFLYCGSDGKVWIVANYQGCFCYNPSDGRLVNYYDTPGSTPEYNVDKASISFRRMVEDGRGGMWASRYHYNLLHADAGMKGIRQLEPVNSPDYFKGDEVEQLFIVDSLLLVASNRHGLSTYDPRSGLVENLFSLPSGATLVDAFLQQDRFVWLSTTKGVWRYDMMCRSRSVVHISFDPTDPLSISGNYVFSTFVDRDGGLWIGTKDGGVSFCGAFQQRVAKVAAVEGRSLEGSVVSGFSFDDRGRVWISTESASLLCHDTMSGKTSTVKVPGLPAMVCAPCCDGDRVWFGSLDGLYCLDTNSMKLRCYGPLRRNAGATDPKIYVIWKSSDGSLYFANTLGLFKYDCVHDDFEQIPAFDGVFVTSLCEAPDGYIWASSYATGVFVWDPVGGGILKNFRHGDSCGLPSDKIASVCCDAAGNIWTVGFSCGLSCFNGENFEVIDTRTNSSLPTDVYFKAIPDPAGSMWLFSDKGLVWYNPSSEAISVYTSRDGLLDSKLTNSGIVLPDGEIFAGSDNGFVHFNPARIASGSTAPDVIVSGIDLMVGPEFEGNVDLAEKIKVEPFQNSFGLQFSVMNMLSPAAARVRCMLEGYDTGWRDVSVDRQVRYTAMPSGTYRLRVATSLTGEQWTEREKPLVIVVKPKFFESGWGLAVIAATLCLVLLLVFAIVTKRQNTIRLKEEEAYRKKAEEEAFMDKMNFFSHVVHEIKTPLTLIRTPLQSVAAKDELDDDARHDLEVMQNNTDYLTQLVNELLEFVRVERKGYVLNCESLDLVEKLSSLIFNYSDTAASSNIRMDFAHDVPYAWISADSAALSKILNNVLINALKYASSRIEVHLRVDARNAVVEISDDGDGIPEGFREDVFKPFVQYHGTQSKLAKGVGIGLPLARSLARMHSGELELLPGEVTCFRFTIPLADAPKAFGVDLDSSDEEPLAAEARPLMLVVDDNADMRAFLQRKFDDTFSVVGCDGADAALKLLRESNVDIMLTDISMPGKDGLALCREVRSDMEISHLPIIILSARTSVESKIGAMEAGADLYIEKPFDMEYLRTSVRNILDRRSLMRKAFSSGIVEADIAMFGLPKRDEEFFHAFDTLITENLSDSTLSNEFLAERLCMSQSTMIRKIRKLLDTSPNNYIRSKRLSTAARMLRDSHGNNVTDICYAVGFTNVSYFAKCFKEQYGVTPSEYASV